MRAFRTAAVISLLIVLPFMMLQWINRRSFAEGFPIVLFVVMWILAVSFMLILPPVARRRAASGPGAHHVGFWSRIALSSLIAWSWVALVLDQMPCFLGVPNCD